MVELKVGQIWRMPSGATARVTGFSLPFMADIRCDSPKFTASMGFEYFKPEHGWRLIGNVSPAQDDLTDAFRYSSPALWLEDRPNSWSIWKHLSEGYDDVELAQIPVTPESQWEEHLAHERRIAAQMAEKNAAFQSGQRLYDIEKQVRPRVRLGSPGYETRYGWLVGLTERWPI